YSPVPRKRSFIPVNIGKMHGSIWCTGVFDRLIDLICARSDGVIGPLSLLSLRRTSFSSDASSPKSTAAGCALQSAAAFFTNVGAGAAGCEGVGGAGAGAAASGAAGLSLFGSSQPVNPVNPDNAASAGKSGNERTAARVTVFME